MNYEKARKIQQEICEKFFFNRKHKEVFADDYNDEPETSEVVYDVFGDVFAVSVVKSAEGNYAIELISEKEDLYVSPIVKLFGLEESDIVSIASKQFELQKKKRPIEIGCSVGPLIEEWGGTLGCFVKDIDSGDNYILSNHHVLFSEAGSKDNFIVQPSVSNGGKSEDSIGLYVRSLAPDPSGVNKFDAAIAGPISIKMQPIIPSFDSPILGVKAPVVGMKVYKIGITTGLTFGIIRSIHSAIKIKQENGTTLDYEDQIQIEGTKNDFATPENFSRSGDSGSALIEYGTNMLIGLHFCGNGRRTSFSNKIEGLFKDLRISL